MVAFALDYTRTMKAKVLFFPAPALASLRIDGHSYETRVKLIGSGTTFAIHTDLVEVPIRLGSQPEQAASQPVAPGPQPTAREVSRLLATLPPGRRRVAQALRTAQGRTYPAVADLLKIHLGTVHQHLRRIRLLHPHVYAALMSERAGQLVQRHEQALARAQQHSQDWHQSQAARRHFYLFGRWPWER
jgi:hypothetical protein